MADRKVEAASYAEKAAREAKVHTSWTEPAPAYENRDAEIYRRHLRRFRFHRVDERFCRMLTYPGRVNSLAQTLLKLTAPGVPDFTKARSYGILRWSILIIAGLPISICDDACSPILRMHTRTSDGAHRRRYAEVVAHPRWPRTPQAPSRMVRRAGRNRALECAEQVATTSVRSCAATRWSLIVPRL